MTYRSQHYPPISEWSPVLKFPDITFINLQYANYEDYIAKVINDFLVAVQNFKDIDQYGDIDEVAVLCGAFDMVVSSKATPPMTSSGVGTPTKIANWKKNSYNNILNNPNVFNGDDKQSYIRTMGCVIQYNSTKYIKTCQKFECLMLFYIF